MLRSVYVDAAASLRRCGERPPTHTREMGRRMAVQRPRPLRLFGLVALVLLLAIVATIAVPPLVLRDARAPDHVAPFVGDARARLLDELDDLLPAHLRFVAARCRADGGAVLAFEQREPPYLGVRFAYAMSGTWPPTGWGGGIGLEQLERDPEIAAFLLPGEVPCE